MKKDLLIYPIIAIIFFFIGKNYIKTTQTLQTPTPIAKTLLNLKLRQDEPQITNLEAAEAKRIEEIISNFENFKYQKDYVGAINLITEPQTEDDKGWLDHFLGNDLIQINNGKPSPRFTNNAYHHLLSGYVINRIYLKNEVVYVDVDELRNVIIGDKYEAKMLSLTFEIIKDKGSYKIAKYYHKEAIREMGQKYEGFVAY